MILNEFILKQRMDCVAFLQWALPKLHMRWGGFRKVHKQVCKRIRRRIQELGLVDFSEYQTYLQKQAEEWPILDKMCIITISRFYRDQGVFKALREKVIPALAAKAKAEGKNLHCWSAACASGEEPYTLSILWEETLAERFSQVDFSIIATDVDAHMIARARRGCYEAGSLRELPAAWKQCAFSRQGEYVCINQLYKNRVHFLQQDIRKQMPNASFDLILCRNLISYYYDEALQTELFQRIHKQLHPEGALVLGAHETLPDTINSFTRWVENEPIYMRT